MAKYLLSCFHCVVSILVVVVLFSVCEIQAECWENITTPLKKHIVHNAIQHFRGNFTDVWASKHVTRTLNCSFTEIWQDGRISVFLTNKDGQGFSASGKLWVDEEEIIHIKVEKFDSPGLIFPLFATSNAIAYYTCYPNVEGAGVSVVAARCGKLLELDTIEDVLKAQKVFKRLQEEFGIPINDGVDYDQC